MARNRTQQSRGDIYESFGRRIAEARANMGLTQSEAASQLEMSKSTYSGYESGTRKVPLSLIVKFSEFYGISPDELINGDTQCQDSRLSVVNDNRDDNVSFDISPIEKEIIYKYRALPADAKDMLLRSLGIEQKGDAMEDCAG